MHGEPLIAMVEYLQSVCGGLAVAKIYVSGQSPVSGKQHMMMRFFKGLWLLPLMALVASASQASAQSTRLHSAAITSADGHHLLWKVEGERGTAYLVGSLHFGTPDMYPLPA
jgi:hypothetical protein